MQCEQVTKVEQILKPQGRSSTAYYVLLAAAGGAVAWFLYAWSYMLRFGMITTGLGDWGSGGGVTWGVFIGGYIWWIGIAHGGLIISAAVRLFKWTTFKPVARLAELLTVFALSMAGLFILLHLGRPERVVRSIIVALPWTIFSSPLVWDVVVITLYFVLSLTYLGLTLRRDIHILRARLPRSLDPLYRLLLLGYRPEEDEKVERMAWWLAFALILLAPLFLHGGVIPWLFAVIPSISGWYGAGQAPTFLSIALTSALGSIIFVAYVFRRVYRWEEVIPDQVFRGLGSGLMIFAGFYLWFQLQKIITGVYAPPIGVGESVTGTLEAPAYWLAMGLTAASVVYFGVQLMRPELFNLHRTVIFGLMPVLATLLEKVLFVIEGTMEPDFRLYRAVPGSYWPSWIELSSIVATVAMVTLLFMAVVKLIPVIEVHAEKEG